MALKLVEKFIELSNPNRAICPDKSGIINPPTDDWRHITQSDDIGPVDIVTPNNAHAEIAIDAARHRKHVYCEKPLANNAASARQMYEQPVRPVASTRCRLCTGCGLTWRLRSGSSMRAESGKVLQSQARFLHEFPLDPRTPLTRRLDAERAGSGSIGDIGSHVIDVARHLVGEIVRVCARMRTFIDQRLVPSGLGAARQRGFGTEVRAESSECGAVRVDDATLLMVEFEDGTVSSIETNWMAAGHNNELSFEISGEHGAISVQLGSLH